MIRVTPHRMIRATRVIGKRWKVLGEVNLISRKTVTPTSSMDRSSLVLLLVPFVKIAPHVRLFPSLNL